MIQGYFEQILLRLSISPIVQTFKVLKQKEGDDEGYLRVKSTLCNGDVFEFSEYVIVEQELNLINEAKAMFAELGLERFIARTQAAQSERRANSLLPFFAASR